MAVFFLFRPYLLEKQTQLKSASTLFEVIVYSIFFLKILLLFVFFLSMLLVHNIHLFGYRQILLARYSLPVGQFSSPPLPEFLTKSRLKL